MKKSQKSLRDWTNQKWRTSDGSPSKGKKRYLPDAAWKALTPGEKAATNRAKANSNKQFVKQPKNIAKKTAKYRAMGGLISNKFQNGGQLPKYETTLPLKEEANFMPWLESQYKTGNITKGDFDFYKKNNYGYNYDFRAAYKEGLKSSLNSKDNMQHWGDIGKKPNHPTFSNESKYHNVDGNIGGSWDGENFIPAQKQNGGTLPYVAPNDLLEVEITPENTELKDQPKELEAYYRDYAAQYPVTDKKDITKQYREGARNYAAEQLLKENPQGDRNRKDYLKSFTEQELATIKKSESKGKVNPTLMQRFEGALKQGAAAGAPGDLRYKKVETESLTDEEMKDVGALDLLGPLAIPGKLVQAGYKDGYSLLDALKGQENNASFIEDIATDPLNLVGLGLVSKGANAAKLLKAYKNLSKLSNAKRASTLQNAYKLNPFAFKPKEGKVYRQVGKPGFDDAVKEGRIYEKGQKQVLNQNPDIDYIAEYDRAIAAKGEPGFSLEKPTNAPFFSKGDLFFPSSFKKGKGKTSNSGVEYLFEGDLPDEALLPRYRDQYLSPEEAAKLTLNTGVLRPEYSDLSNFEIYKKDWLRGYKKIEVPTLNERLRNNPSYVINPDVRSTEKLAKESEPYLKSSTPPRSRQDEIIEGFAPGLEQERIKRTTVNFNPDGSVMSQEKAMGGTLDKSVMGYRDDSPYKNEPYLDINTPTGEIDMSETGVSLYANGKLLKPYSGKHKFNTSKVREVPVNNSWLDKYK